MLGFLIGIFCSYPMDINLFVLQDFFVIPSFIAVEHEKICFCFVTSTGHGWEKMHPRYPTEMKDLGGVRSSGYMSCIHKEVSFQHETDV